MRSFVEWSGVNKDLETAQGRVSEAGLAMMVRHLLIPIASTSSKGRIEAQKTAGGKRWRTLKESTQRVRRSLGLPGIYGHYPINKRTGNLERFLQSADGEVAILPEFIQGSWPADVSMDGTRLMYAYHTAQAGSKRWGTPPRPIVALAATEIIVLDQMTRLYLEQVFGENNGAIQAMEGRVFG